jgi:hypothetical protein
MIKAIIGLLIVIADIWAIIKVFQSDSSMIAKILWTLVILIFPFIGLVIWYFAGPGRK